MYLNMLSDSCEVSLLDDLPIESFEGLSTDPDHPETDIVINWNYSTPDTYWQSSATQTYFKVCFMIT